MWSVFGSAHRCEQLFSLMKIVKSRSRMRLTDKHLDGYIRIATAEDLIFLPVFDNPMLPILL
jgi:hypothetical protein